MPILHIYYHKFSKIDELNTQMIAAISKTLNIPLNRVWLFWHQQSNHFICPIWETDNENLPPIIFVYCKSLYTKAQIESLISDIKDTFSDYLGPHNKDLFIGINRFQPGELFVNQTLYTE